MFGLLRDVWHYRGFVHGSIRRDIAAQYRGSLLGAAWVLIGPLAMILIYTLVFSHLMKSRLTGVDSAFGYSIFLCAGLLPWTFFTDSLSRLQAVFVANSNLMKKATFPRICLPVIALGTAALQFRRHRRAVPGFLVVAGSFPGWVLLAALPALAVQVALPMGLGVLFAHAERLFSRRRTGGEARPAVLVLADTDRLSARLAAGMGAVGARLESDGGAWSRITSRCCSISACPTRMPGSGWRGSPRWRWRRCGWVSRPTAGASAKWWTSFEQLT